MAASESCYSCVYSYWDRQQAMWTMGVGFPARAMCGNQPDFPGRMKECTLGRVCRNFRARPPTPAGETVKTISLGDGFYAYVDAADYEWLNQWSWHLHNGYAARQYQGKRIYMHRAIMQPPKRMVVDHKNHNKLDDTRANLKVCTQRENLCNSEKRRGTASRFRGLYFCKRTGKWCARIKFEGKPVYLGSFAEEMEAARAHDRGAVAYFGESARLNFPQEWPPQRRREVHARWQKTQGAGTRKKGKARGSRRKAKGAKPVTSLRRTQRR